jgi:proteic killer suppression protein
MVDDRQLSQSRAETLLGAERGSVAAGDYIKRIEMILDRLDDATRPEQMNAIGLRFHALTGNMRGRFAVTVSANWRITFGWSEKDAIDVDLEDYH